MENRSSVLLLQVQAVSLAFHISREVALIPRRVQGLLWPHAKKGPSPLVPRPFDLRNVSHLVSCSSFSISP